jgi:hypothetical protein
MTAYMRAAVVILAGAALFGCATTGQNAASKPAVTAAAVKDPNCLTDTGSRIAATGTSKCRGYGRAYSSSDIDKTGQTDAGSALALLDPSITVHH